MMTTVVSRDSSYLLKSAETKSHVNTLYITFIPGFCKDTQKKDSGEIASQCRKINRKSLIWHALIQKLFDPFNLTFFFVKLFKFVLTYQFDNFFRQIVQVCFDPFNLTFFSNETSLGIFAHCEVEKSSNEMQSLYSSDMLNCKREILLYPDCICICDN